MAIENELVNVVRFEVEGEQSLERAQNLTDGVKENVSAISTAEEKGERQGRRYDQNRKELNRTLGSTRQTLGLVEGGLGRVASSFAQLGIVTAATSGIMAAWAGNGSNLAVAMEQTAFATQLPLEELQQLQSVYSQLGLAAESFAQDAANYQAMTGRSLNLEEIVSLSERFASMSERDALNVGRAFGISDDTIRVWRQGGEAIQALSDNAENLRHINTEEDISALTALARQASSTWQTIRTISTSIQADLAPAMESSLETIQQQAIQAESTARSFAKLASEILNIATNNIASNDQTVRPDGLTSAEALQSEDRRTRQIELGRRYSEQSRSAIPDTFGLILGGVVEGVGGFLNDGVSGAIEGASKQIDVFQNRRQYYEDRISEAKANNYAVQNAVNDWSTEQERQAEMIYKSSRSRWLQIGAPVFEEYQPLTMDQAREQVRSRSQQSVLPVQPTQPITEASQSVPEVSVPVNYLSPSTTTNNGDTSNQNSMTFTQNNTFNGVEGAADAVDLLADEVQATLTSAQVLQTMTAGGY